MLGDERGISLAEVLIALVLLSIVGAAMVTLLTSATAATKLARHRTIAQQAALGQIEAIRAMDYNDVGIVSGNPAGCLGVTTPTTRCPNSSYPPATTSITNGGIARDTVHAGLVRQRPGAAQLHVVRELQEGRRHGHAEQRFLTSSPAR